MLPVDDPHTPRRRECADEERAERDDRHHPRAGLYELPNAYGLVANAPIDAGPHDRRPDIDVGRAQLRDQLLLFERCLAPLGT